MVLVRCDRVGCFGFSLEAGGRRRPLSGIVPAGRASIYLDMDAHSVLLRQTGEVSGEDRDGQLALDLDNCLYR